MSYRDPPEGPGEPYDEDAPPLRIERDGVKKEYRLQELQRFRFRAWLFGPWRTKYRWKTVGTEDWALHEDFAKQRIENLKNEYMKQRQRTAASTGPEVIWESHGKSNRSRS